MYGKGKNRALADTEMPRSWGWEYEEDVFKQDVIRVSRFPSSPLKSPYFSTLFTL
jgi:hypothetical protein